MQQFVLIQSAHDLRAPKALADLEQMAQRIGQLPNIDAVRGITRPTGDVLEQAKATYQAGEVGSKLKDASNLIHGNESNLQKLVDGEYQLADALNQIRTQVLGSIQPIRTMLSQMSAIQSRYGGSKTIDDLDKSAKMVSEMTSLGDAIGGQLVRVGDVYKWSSRALDMLNATPFCNYYQACNELRAGLQNVSDGNDPETVQKVINLGHMLQQYKSDPGMDDKVRGLAPISKASPNCSSSFGSTTPVTSTGGCSRQLRVSTFLLIRASSLPTASSCWSTRSGRWAAA